MTDLKTRIELALVLLGISLFIFFTPFVLGSKQPAIKASVRQNMDFLFEMAKKYQETHRRAPASLEVLVRDAQEKRYNKTLFNPILKNTGDAIDRQVVEVYDESFYQSLGPAFRGRQYAGKTGFYSNGVQLAIYGHLAEGELLQGENGEILVLSNAGLPVGPSPSAPNPSLSPSATASASASASVNK